MTTTNNTNYSVKALVAKYRNFVIENAPKKEGKIAERVFAEKGRTIPLSNLDWHPDYQLIITLYNAVAGDKADKQVQQVLSEYAAQYYKDALTTEEFEFLCDNFSETVAELLENGLFLWNGDKCRYNHLFSNPAKLQLLKERFLPQQNSTIYMCDSGCDIAELYSNCNVVGNMYGELFNDIRVASSHYDLALGKIWLFSKNILSQLSMYFYDVDGEYLWPMTSLSTPQPMDYVIYGTTASISLFVVEKLYNKLSPNGKMFVFTSYEDMAKHDEKMKSFRQRLVTDKSIESLISFKERRGTQGILLVIEKCQHDNVEIVSDYSNQKIIISSESLDADILWPGYYIAPKPKDGISLSSIAYGKKLKDAWEMFLYDEKPEAEEKLSPGAINDLFAGLPIPNPSVDKFEKLIEFEEKVLPHMFVAIPSNLSSDYKDANICSKKMHVAGEPLFEKETIVIIEQPCVIMGISSIEKKVIAGYITSIPKEGICTGRPLSCLVPVQGIDVRYLCSILLTPSVSEQIRIVCDGVNDVISMITDKIIVPNHNEKERLQYLLEANYEAMLSSQKTLRQEQDNFRKAVRMRKHALSQLLSSVSSLFSTLNFIRQQDSLLKNDDIISPVRKTTVGDVFDSVSHKLEDMKPALDHIADIDYSFGPAEWIDPEAFLNDYIAKNENGWLNFMPIKGWIPGENTLRTDIKDPNTNRTIKKKGEPIDMLFFPKRALEKVLDNIVANAMAHGFTDTNRNDYQLKFSWEKNDFSLIIKVENNGSPIPVDRDTASLLEYGVSTSLHQDGHNGIGCHEVDEIMQRYEGSVRIISTPDEEFTVKYVLVFQSNV